MGFWLVPLIFHGNTTMNDLKHVMMAAGLLSVLTAGTGFSVWADGGNGHDLHGIPGYADIEPGGGEDDGIRHHGGSSPLAMKEVLGLSEEQVIRLHPLEMEYRKTLIQNEADFRMAMVDLGTLMDARDTDTEAITRKIDEMSLLQKTMMLFRVETFLKVKGVLSPAQYDQFRSRLRTQMEEIAH
jgi:Spy/CpxP family protein refolding chaperone